jgi:hypothetical protein
MTKRLDKRSKDFIIGLKYDKKYQVLQGRAYIIFLFIYLFHLFSLFIYFLEIAHGHN